MKPGSATGSIRTAWALTIYCALSALYFGAGLMRHLSQIYCGLGSDPTIQMWALSWWPYALRYHLSPFITQVIWAPSGYNLARATSIPGPSIIVYPVTRLFGPVVAYNLLCLALPAAAAFSAFVLCRYLCHRFWPALLGGYLFGFSQYMLSQIGGHLFLLCIFPVPLAIYLGLRRLNRELSKYVFLPCFALVLAFEFLSSTELFATTTVFGVMALALAYLLIPEIRAALRSTIGDIVQGYGVVLLLLSPYFYYVLAGGVPPVANPAEAYSNDLLAFVVPTPVLWLGGHAFGPVSGRFRASWGEMSGYLGPGVWLIFALFAWTNWRNATARLLLLSFSLIAVASLGPELHVAGAAHGRLPWLIADKLPLMDLALPGRFGMYLFLVAALVVAIYLSRAGISYGTKALLGVCALVFVVPNLPFTQAERTIVNTPVFFQSGHYRQYISKGDIILILPYDALSQALLWQAQTDFYFRIVTGFYIPPDDYSRWPVSSSFGTGDPIPDFPEQLERFLTAHRVKAIILDAHSPGRWPAMLSKAGLTAIASQGVLFYQVPAQVLVSRHSVPHSR